MEFFKRVDAGELIVRSLKVYDSGLIVIFLSIGYEIAGFCCDSDWQDLVYWSDRMTNRSILLTGGDFHRVGESVFGVLAQRL